MLNWALLLLYVILGLISIPLNVRQKEEVEHIGRVNQMRYMAWKENGSPGIFFSSNHNSHTEKLGRIGMVLSIANNLIIAYLLFCAWQNQTSEGWRIATAITAIVALFGRFSIRRLQTTIVAYLAINTAFAVFLALANVL